MPIRHALIGALSATLLASAVIAQPMPVYFAPEGAAMAGYDPVSYFQGDIPVQGRPEISVTWKGAEWHFASLENRALFEANPRAFAPQFGGYCSYAMAQGLLKGTDPGAWQVVDGRLYLTYSPEIERKWREDQVQYIHQAEGNWPEILYWE